MTIAASKWDIFELSIPVFDPYMSSFPSLVGISVLLLRGKCVQKDDAVAEHVSMRGRVSI